MSEAQATGTDPAVRRLTDRLTCVLAPNPSPMTGPGTNTYILGREGLVVIDPGPENPAHLSALTREIGTRKVSHILITHSHLDHSALAPALAQQTGAEVLAFGGPHAGRSPVMQALADDGLAGGGEGVDHGFVPHRTVPDGARLDTGAGQITALHTPGHMGNHHSFAWEDHVFTGDLVMGWASSLVSPPDGDLSDYMASLARLRRLSARVFHSGHGDPIDDPTGRIDWLIAHRKDREGQILGALHAPATLDALVRTVYADTPATMWPAAARNLLAHLVDLHGRGLIVAAPRLSARATFARAAA